MPGALFLEVFCVRDAHADVRGGGAASLQVREFCTAKEGVPYCQLFHCLLGATESSDASFLCGVLQMEVTLVWITAWEEIKG